MTFNHSLHCIGYISILILFTNCKINRAYTNGQEGLETVYKAKQISVGADYFGSPGTGGIHADIAYSPINNLAVLYDLKTSGTQHMYHTVAVGFYSAKYQPYQLQKYVDGKKTIDIGRHLDMYAGMSYGYTKNSSIPQGNSFFNFNENYDLNFQAKRYFIQAGAHFKAKYLGFDFVLRRLWLDVDKIEVFGLQPNSDIRPEEDFKDSSIRSYTEFSFKMNFVGNYKPIYIGVSRMYGNDTNFTFGAFSSSTAFIGANLDIHHLFKKKTLTSKTVDYIYEEK